MSNFTFFSVFKVCSGKPGMFMAIHLEILFQRTRAQYPEIGIFFYQKLFQKYLTHIHFFCQGALHMLC